MSAALDGLIERLKARVYEERMQPSCGHNAADRERAELIKLLNEAIFFLMHKPEVKS